MKLKALGLTAIAVSAAALVAACGGGGGGEAATSDVQLSGVAATGLALASSPVDVKCASGTGTATTNESGGYTVTVTDGALPCIVKVTGTVNGVEVTLHSLAQAGTTSGSTTTATANVTPLTEMILARAAGTLPADLFANFGTGSAVAAETLTQATTDILSALGTAAGVDLSGIDPFKATLVAATPSNLSGGNDYDKLLDQLGTVVNAATLPQVVSQIASTTGSGAPITLDEVVANVSNGSLAGCPQALSGKYRAVDYDGRSDEFELNFKTMLVAGELHMEVNDAQPCEVKILDTVADGGDNDAGPTTIVFGPSGMGVARDQRALAYVFPVQSTTLASVTGKTWEFIESGTEVAGSANPVQGQWVGEMKVAADGKTDVCDYENLDFSSCIAANETVSFSQSGSTLLLNYEGTTSPVYGYRAPNGSLTLFGFNNDAELKSSFVLTQPQTVQPQPQGEVVRFWNIVQKMNMSSGELFNDFAPGSLTISASSADSITRTLAGGSTDTWLLNQPIAGLRKRATPLTYQRALPGQGITVGIDGNSSHWLSVAVGRPKATTE